MLGKKSNFKKKRVVSTKPAGASKPLAQKNQLAQENRRQGLENPVQRSIGGSPVPTGESRLTRTGVRETAVTETSGTEVYNAISSESNSSGANAPGKNYVGVDFPQVGEILTSAHYAIRISTSATEGVSISIDGKEWQPCRESVGFWWYDWSGFSAGVHTVVARISVGKRFMKSKPRTFTALI